jgi:bacteriorhodopsin
VRWLWAVLLAVAIVCVGELVLIAFHRSFDYPSYIIGCIAALAVHYRLNSHKESA